MSKEQTSDEIVSRVLSRMKAEKAAAPVSPEPAQKPAEIMRARRAADFAEVAKRDDIPDRLVAIVTGKLQRTPAMSSVSKFMDEDKAVMALCGPVNSGKSVAAVRTLTMVRGQYLRPADVLREGVHLAAVERARKVAVTVLDGLSRQDIAANYHLAACVIRWLAEAAYEYNKRLIITVDDHWQDRPNPEPGRQPIRGVGGLLGEAMMARVEHDGILAEVGHS